MLTLPKVADPLAPFCVYFRAWPFDLDLNMHVNNARYLSWMDLGRIDMMGRTGVMQQAFKKKWAPIVAHIDIRFIRPIKPLAKICLETQIEKTDEKYFYIKQTFFGNEQPIAIAHVKGLLIGPEGKIPPADVLAAAQKQS